MSDRSEVRGQCYIDGQWCNGRGQEASRKSPSDGRIVWSGNWSDSAQIESAIQIACTVFRDWASRSLEDRMMHCQKFAEIVLAKKEELAMLIAIETGKPLWEAHTEVESVVAKVSNSIDAVKQRRSMSSEASGDVLSVTRYRPMGAMLVLGPYNLPAHLPGAHIVPALLAGNTVVFKPSELAPAVGQWLAQTWSLADLPRGVFNLLHGNADVAIAAASSEKIAGVLFTGSHRAGVSLHRLLAGQPQKILALEMGGNNPLVVHRTKSYGAAALAIIMSAYITSGQRCTCSRRLIVTGEETYQSLVEQLCRSIPKVRVGLPLDKQQPFMGTMIDDRAAERMLDAQENLIQSGAKAWIPMRRDRRCSALLTPGLLSVDGVSLDDTEHFGPMLLVQKAIDLDEAIALANRTQFGLSAGFFGDHIQDYHHFLDQVHAGVVTWNRPTTGASGRLPFGGIGASGNHRPSGFFAADYCSYPVASLESHDLSRTTQKIPGLEKID